jgi:Ca2+-binding EF-hand superfamily protein
MFIFQSIQVPLTAKQLDRLITMLDKDGDGEVDYG